MFLFTPCWDEPFGLVAVEAMACGLPVAAFDQGAAREVDRRGRAFAPAGDVAALAERDRHGAPAIPAHGAARRGSRRLFTRDRWLDRCEDALSRGRLRSRGACAATMRRATAGACSAPAIARMSAPARAYALVDFPDHANVGDSAIWLGELAMLRQVTGRGPVYVSTWHDFDADAFRRACPTGTLFLHGGGNLGDIWPHHQRFREHLLATVRDRPVVQLPQSIHFRDPARAGRFAALAAEHPDFTLYVRDARSHAFATARIACPVDLIPGFRALRWDRSRAAKPRSRC